MTEILEQFNLWAAIDITVIAFIIYNILLLIRGTKAAQMVTGIIIIIVVAAVFSAISPLTTFNWLLDKFSASFIIILIILFQDDIRHALSRMGKKPFLPSTEFLSSVQIIDEIVRAAGSLANKSIGGLIVIERNIILTRYVNVGTSLDCKISKEILLSIFNPSSPIHDGAAIIQGGRIASAGCFLPLTRSEIDANLGTRHRAAFGISESTDAVVVLISEEAGAISLVVDGKILSKIDTKTLRNRLRDLLTPEAATQQKPENRAETLSP